MSLMICSTCLSFNRTLVLFDRENIDKYGSLFAKTVIEKVHAVCWECMSMFRKLYRFKSQVLQAQECMNNTNSKIKDLPSFSRLKSSSLNFIDICCGQNIAKSQEKHNLNVKQTEIKSEKDIEIEIENRNEERENENGLLKTYWLTVSGFKSDDSVKDADTDDVSSIKIETDDIYSDEITVEEFNVNTAEVRKENVEIDTEKKFRKSKKSTMTKYNYIITKMTEEEMLATRETDRQSDRFKNKVKYRCESCIVGFFNKDLYDKHVRNKHSERAGNHTCRICETRFTKTNFYKEHVESHYLKVAVSGARNFSSNVSI